MSIYKEGQLVWAKIRGHNWWPARVMESNEKKNGQISAEVRVEFIGEGKLANISISNLVDFQENYSQYSVTKNQKLIEVLKTIPMVPFLQLSQGHENGSLNFTFDPILLDSKSDMSKRKNHYYPHKTHIIEIPSISQPSHKKSPKINSSLRVVDENKSLNAKRSIENRQESNSKPIFRCSYETIPDLIQNESECWQMHCNSLTDPPFYNSHRMMTEEALREFAHSGGDSSEPESEEDEDEDEDYEVIQKKLKAETAKNKPQRRRGKRARTAAVKEPVVAVVVKKDKVGNETKDDAKSKSTGLIEGLVKRLLEMYENNKIQLIEEGQNYRGFSMPPTSFKSKNKYSIEELASKDIKRMVEGMRDLLSQVIIWLTENLQGMEKITLINLIYDIVDGAIQGSIPFFQQLKHFFITTYEFLLKNKQLTNIMDNNMISSIIDLVHEVEAPEYEEPMEVAVPHISNEKEHAKCESVNHVERSTRKASGTSSESNSHIAEHMTEKEQEEEQNLGHNEEEEVKEVSCEVLMQNMLLRRNVCQKFAKLFQKLYKITSNSAQDLILLIEGRIQSFFQHQNVESYVKSIRILYKLIKMKVIQFREVETITYMEFDDFREMLENKIYCKDDFSFQTEVILNIQPGYSSLVLDDEVEMI